MFPEVLYELFSGMPRQGPGSNEYTRRAYESLPNPPHQPRILDIGCGSGVQTLELARISGGEVTALDNYQDFLDNLVKSARSAGLDKQIKTTNASMFELPFAKSSFDIIWSEAAIFIIGFEKGLYEWKHFLKLSGYLVVSEMAWITSERPNEISAYMEGEYPAIKSHQENLDIIRKSGYYDLGSFILPEHVWIEHFYIPYQSRLDLLKDKYAANHEVFGVLDACQKEIDMYMKYSRYYGYVFYMMQQV